MPPGSSDQKVFLSSTAKDLDAYRKAAYKAIQQLEGYRCVGMEDFTSTHLSAEAYLEKKVSTCDLFVGVLGICYGSRPRNSSKSYTELEYKTAKKNHKPCLMFLTPDDFMIPASLIPDDKSRKAQLSFRKEVSQDVIREYFKTPDELALKVVSAIRNHESTAARPLSREKNDCVILCGGSSKRLWPLTSKISKHLLPVGGKPVLARVLDDVHGSALIRKIYLLTDANSHPQIKSFLEGYPTSRGAGKIEILVEPGGLGPVGALDYAVRRRKLRDVLLLAGDNLLGFALDEFLQFARRNAGSSNAIYKFPLSEDVSEYGVVSLSPGNRVSELREKQAVSTYRNISTACYFLRAADVALIKQYIEWEGAGSLGSFIHWLIAEGSPLQGYVFSSFWFDVGTREKLLEANWKFLKDSHRGSTLKESYIKGPVQLAPGSSVENSKIGPNVYIGRGVKIVDSDIHNSLIMDGSQISHSSIINSIVGPQSKLEGCLFELVCGPDTHIVTDPGRDRTSRLSGPRRHYK